MRGVNKSWMAVVAAALLLGTLVGVVWARPNHRPGAAVTTRMVTLSDSDFIPAWDGYSFSKGNGYVVCNSSCTLSAPVVFPTLSAVTVERIKLHVSDGSATLIASASLYRDKPASGSHSKLGAVSSPMGSSGGLKTYTSGDINKVVWPSQRASIVLYIEGPSINVFGVTVEYHVNS
jgi:hypothetical protein